MIKKEFLILFGFYSFFYIIATTQQTLPETYTYNMPAHLQTVDPTCHIYTWDNTEKDLQCFPAHRLDDFHEDLSDFIWTETDLDALEINSKPIRTQMASLVTDIWYDVELVRPDKDHLTITFLSIMSNGPLYHVGNDYAIDQTRLNQFDTFQELLSRKKIHSLDLHSVREQIWDAQRQWWEWIDSNIIKNTGTQGPKPNIYNRVYNSAEAQKFGDTQLISLTPKQ